MYEDDDIFDVGPILGKGRKYNEYRDDQARDPKTGKWTPEGAAAMARAREKAKREAAGKKPASKPKSAAKPSSKKPASKPKAPEKKPKAKPKAEAPPAKKPRARKPKQDVAATEQPESRQSTALVPADQHNKPIDIQSEPVPETPASGLVERDRQQLKQQYDRYDALNAELDKMSAAIDAKQTRADRVYDELSRTTGERMSRSLNDELNRLDDELLRDRAVMSRKAADRDRLRSSIDELDRRLRGQKRRYIAKLFEEKASTAVDFKTAFNKIVPNNGQPSGDAGTDPLGLVFGWAIVCKESGKPYFDTQGDHIPEDSMLKAATDFMLTKRDLKVMHKGKRVGTVVFAWPVTKDIAKAMGLDGSRTGLMIGVKPDSATIVDRFREGQYTGFSIGGNRLVDEPVL